MIPYLNINTMHNRPTNISYTHHTQTSPISSFVYFLKHQGCKSYRVRTQRSKHNMDKNTHTEESPVRTQNQTLSSLQNNIELIVNPRQPVRKRRYEHMHDTGKEWNIKKRRFSYKGPNHLLPAGGISPTQLTNQSKITMNLDSIINNLKHVTRESISLKSHKFSLHHREKEFNLEAVGHRKAKDRFSQNFPNKEYKSRSSIFGRQEQKQSMRYKTPKKNDIVPWEIQIEDFDHNPNFRSN